VTRFRRSLIVAIALAGVAAPALAQSEKVSIRMSPQPGQTVKMTLTQDVDLEVSFGAALPGVEGAMKLAVKTVAALTQKTGAPKPDGTIDAEITYDESRTETLLNGQPISSSADTQLVGKAVVVTYGQNGQIVDIKGLPAGDALTPDMFKQMLEAFSGSLPATALAVGETTKGPMTFNLPLPIPGADAMKMSGESRLRLVSIDTDAKGRSAKFESALDGKLSSKLDVPLPGVTGAMVVEIDMIGTGTSVMDLDKRVLRSNDYTAKIDGKITNAGAPAADPAAFPPMLVRGTVTVKIVSN
jgi:hypothetical protein